MNNVDFYFAFTRLNLGINELFDLFNHVYQKMPAQIGNKIFAEMDYPTEKLTNKHYLEFQGQRFKINELLEGAGFYEEIESAVVIEMDNRQFDWVKKLVQQSEFFQYRDRFLVHLTNVEPERVREARDEPSKIQNGDYFVDFGLAGPPQARPAGTLSLSITANEQSISKEWIKNIVLMIAQSSPQSLFMSYTRYFDYSDKAQSIFSDRMAVDWLTFLPAEILPEEVPSAHEVMYFPNIGSLIIATEKVYNYRNPAMRKTAANIEKELYHLGLLPITAQGYSPTIDDLPFVSREQRLRNTRSQ